MTDETTTTVPSLEDWQHWALVMARANQMIMEAWADNLSKGKDMPGFGLVVTASGHRSFVVQYRARGKSRRMTIDDVLGLAAARKRARALPRHRLAAGADLPVAGYPRALLLAYPDCIPLR